MDGLESRYFSRFAKQKNIVDRKAIKGIDQAKQVAEDAKIRSEVIATQKRNAEVLFSTAENALGILRNFQMESGEKLFSILPAATSEIKASPSKQQAYVRETLKFFCDMLVRAQEEYIRARDEAHELKEVVLMISATKTETDILGEMEDLDLEADDDDSPIVETIKSFTGEEDSDEEDDDEEE